MRDYKTEYRLHREEAELKQAEKWDLVAQCWSRAQIGLVIALIGNLITFIALVASMVK